MEDLIKLIRTRDARVSFSLVEGDPDAPYINIDLYYCYTDEDGPGWWEGYSANRKPTYGKALYVGSEEQSVGEVALRSLAVSMGVVL